VKVSYCRSSVPPAGLALIAPGGNGFSSAFSGPQECSAPRRKSAINPPVVFPLHSPWQFFSTLLFGLAPRFNDAAERERVVAGREAAAQLDPIASAPPFALIAQVALSLLLLAGAGLFDQGFLNLRATKPGSTRSMRWSPNSIFCQRRNIRSRKNIDNFRTNFAQTSWAARSRDGWRGVSDAVFQQ